MKLLILTQAVNKHDVALGFFLDWVREFAKHCEKLTVVCLYKGEYELPENVKVLSLGKDSGVSRFGYLIRLYRYLWQERKNYDYVFVHMNDIYVVLCGLVWKVLGKKVGLWRAHKSVTWSLRVAEKLVDVIFTSTKEGFRLETGKLKIVGQGINIKMFDDVKRTRMSGGALKLVSVGRISPIKNIDTLIEAVKYLNDDGINVEAEIIGGVLNTDDEKYSNRLKAMVAEYGLESKVRFVGPVDNDMLSGYLHNADLFVHTSDTGSLDKVVLEAIACGLPVLSSNIASKLVLNDERLFFLNRDARELSVKIAELFRLPAEVVSALVKNSQAKVKSEHSLEELVKKILSQYE